MQVFSIAALIGASSILLLPYLPLLLWLWMALCGLFVLNIFFHYRLHHRKWLKRCVLFLTVSAIFFVLAVFTAHQRLKWQLASSIENKPIAIQGTIVSLPDKDLLRTSFILAITRIANKPIETRNVKLSWYGKVPYLSVGDTWSLLVKLKRVHGFANPGGFDYEKYMLQHDIVARGYVRDSRRNHLLHSNWNTHLIDRIRQKLGEHIHIALKTSPYEPMISALVIGDKNGINASEWQVLQRTGTNHLMVIAGLHIGMISGLVFYIISFLWRRSRRLVLCFPAQQAAAIAALLTAFFYSALAGFSIPTERATVMIAVFMSAFIYKRNLPLGLGIAIALISVLLIHPLACMSVGFWLSFAAVAVICYGMSARLRMRGKWWKWGRLQVVVSLGLVPFTLLLFQNASIISPVANSIVIPIVGFIVVPLSLLASVLSFVFTNVSTVLFHASADVLNIVWHILSWLASFSFLSWQQAVYSGWVMFSVLIGVMLILAPRGLPCRYLGIVFCLPLFLSKPITPTFASAKFTLLDVGQGLASVLQTAHHVLVFDTGAKFGPGFNLGEAVVVPFLRSQGISKVDMMVISHGDNDHIGGAQSILSAMPVKQIVTSVPNRFKSRHANFCLEGEHWQWDGVKFRFLYPDKSHLGLDNNSSCVLRISVGKKHLLLTGDIEKTAEDSLVKQDGRYLRAQIIVAPHHGSKTSSSLDFLLKVRPKFVLFPVGYLNRYHFPSQQVLLRYQKLGAKLYRTDNDGAISLFLDKNRPIKPEAYLSLEKRFWR